MQKAFCHRAAIAHSLVNCLTEVYFDRAIKHAEELDEKFKQGGPVGPLQCVCQVFETCRLR